jgi:hypothetical protein
MAKAKREARAQIGGVGAGCGGHRYWRKGDLRRGTAGSCGGVELGAGCSACLMLPLGSEGISENEG